MPVYESNLFDPPAPVARVTLRHPSTGASLSEIPMLIDTGADVTLIPRQYTEQLGITPIQDRTYSLEGFDGGAIDAEVVELELIFQRRKYKGQFLLIDQPLGILGRNILNTLVLLFDGPHGTWEQQKR